MDANRWQQIEAMVEGALAVPDGERAAWLSQNCNGDAALRAEVESLLAFEDQAGNFLGKPAAAKASTLLLQHDSERQGNGHHVGPFRILREIGHGGMGAVYEAARDDGEFTQRVALKLIRAGLGFDDESRRRFLHERQILAQLEHQNIARLLDGGTTEDGTPYLAMEYVDGLPLDEFCTENKLGIDRRLEIFSKVCAAVAHAHRHLVIHRDLKPSNIFVEVDGTPKLLDFGIAKLVTVDDGDTQTMTGLRAFTPDYASPEQVLGGQITTASDIYSLGVILYEVLTGERPFKFKDASPAERVRILSSTEPTKPSDAFRDRETGRHGDGETKEPPSTLAPSPRRPVPPSHLRGDLDNIVLMALRKEPLRRYRSVEEFAGDIERHVKGLPVFARPNTLAYRAEKFIQRNTVGVIAASLVVLAVLAGLIATTWQARVAGRQRDQARQAQTKAEQLNSFLQKILSAASPEEKGKDAKVIEVLNDAVKNIDTEFANQPELKAQALLTIGQTYIQLGLMDEAEKTLRQALKLDSELYGPENKATASSMIYLGAALLDKAKYDEAEGLLSKAIQTERRLASAGSKELAFALDVLGELHVRKAAFEKAKPLLQESVSMFDKLSGGKNPDSALTLISLGRAQAFSGDLVGAEATYRQSVAIYRQLPSRYEVRLATALVNLGYLLVAKGNYDEGIRTMREADNIFFQKQGESFSSFASKTYLCTAYFNKSDYDLAIAEGNKAIDMGRKLTLSDTPDFTATLENVGLALTRTKRAKEGEPLLREGLGRVRKSFPNEAPIVEGALGECLTAQNRFAEAEPLIVNGYETLKASQGPSSPRTIAALKRAIELYEKWKKPDLADKYRTLLPRAQ